MESNNDYALNRLKILSKDNSFNKNTGSLIVDGGIGCKKNISSESLSTDCINASKNINIKGNACIHGNTTINKILPQDELSEIGSSSKKINKLHINDIDTNNLYINNSLCATKLKSNSIEVKSCVHLGLDKFGNNMIDLNNSSRDIKLNTDNLQINDNNINILGVSKSNILLNSLIRKAYQTETINSGDSSYDLYPNASIILINKSNCSKINLMKKKNVFCGSNIQDGSHIKIYNKSNITLNINNYIIKSLENIEFLFIINKWVSLTHNVCQSNNSSVFSMTDSNFL